MKADVIRYLGYEETVDLETDQKIDEYIEALDRAGSFIYEIFDFEGGQVKGTTLRLEGKSIENILKGVDQIVLFAATLGHNVDQEIKRLSYASSSDMMIYDACASGRIEDLIDQMSETIEGYKTPRFSPGYGDLTLSIQSQIIRVLNAEKKLGITVSKSFLMTPKKSVTGIIGLSSKELNNNYRACDDCLLRTSCNQKICKRAK